jgi:hypothetical protein
MAATVSNEPMVATASAGNIYCQAPSCGQAVAKELKCGSCFSVIYCSKSVLKLRTCSISPPFLSQLLSLAHVWL